MGGATYLRDKRGSDGWSPETEVEGVGDECMPDGDLEEEGDGLREETEVLQTEVMPSVECQPEGASVLCCLDEGGYSLGAICWIVRSVGFGVELDTVGTNGTAASRFLRSVPTKIEVRMPQAWS